LPFERDLQRYSAGKAAEVLPLLVERVLELRWGSAG
jgi:hypothetical protein